MNIPIDAKSFTVLKKLLVSEVYLTANELAKDLDISKRSVYYAISMINDYLTNEDISIIEIERKIGILLNEQQRNQIKKSIDSVSKTQNYIFAPTERVNYIICLILQSKNTIYVEELSTKLNVSRNTIFNDLKVVESKLRTYDLKISYTLKEGYKIKGGISNKRAIYLNYVSMLLPLFNSGIIDFGDRIQINIDYYLLKNIEKKLNVRYVSGTLLSLAIMIVGFTNQGEEVELTDLDNEEIKNTKEFELIEQYFPSYSENEKLYITLHLLGARLQVVPIFDKSVSYDQEVYQIANNLKMEFERLACVSFDNDNEVLEALYSHLKTSMYRYKYGIILENPIAEEVVKNYNQLYELTKRACDYLDRQIGIPISRSEIAYIALHFGSFLRKKTNDRLRILIVCPNGVATGNMLKKEILELVPTAEILGVQPFSGFVVWDNCDLIISTVEINSDMPSIVVKPILSDNDRKTILNYVPYSINNSRKNYDPNDVYQTFKKFVKDGEAERFKNAIFSYFGSIVTFQSGKIGLNDLLDQQRISFIENLDWRTAINKASEPLLYLEKISQDYIDKMIGEIEHFGPYNFITEGVVLAHAKPIDENSNLDVALGISKNGIEFAKNKIANVIIILSVDYQKDHFNILKNIMGLFGVATNVDQLVRLKDKEKILKFIEESIHD